VESLGLIAPLSPVSIVTLEESNENLILAYADEGEAPRGCAWDGPIFDISGVKYPSLLFIPRLISEGVEVAKRLRRSRIDLGAEGVVGFGIVEEGDPDEALGVGGRAGEDVADPERVLIRWGSSSGRVTLIPS